MIRAEWCNSQIQGDDGEAEKERKGKEERERRSK